MKSVFQNSKKCFVCGTTFNVHDHHIFFGTSNRKNSERRGLKVFLCAHHHNMSNEGVHFDKELDLKFKQMGQRYYEENYGNRSDFIREFGRNYLD